MTQTQSFPRHNGDCQNQGKSKAELFSIASAQAGDEPDRNCRARAREPTKGQRQALDSPDQDCTGSCAFLAGRSSWRRFYGTRPKSGTDDEKTDRGETCRDYP